MRYSTLAASMTLALGLSANLHASLPGQGVSVQAFHSPIAEEKFQTVIVNKALAKLGYDVQPIKEVDYSAGYTAMANGDITYTAVNWFPLHNNMYSNAGGDDKFYRKGTYISGAAQGYLIDKKTADQYGIDSIDDLKDPKLAALFDTDGDGKADLAGCQAGWGCEGVIEHQLTEFKLRDAITHKQGQYAAIISDTIARFKQGKPVLYYTWTPYWVSGKLVPGKDVIWLEVPYSANPNGTDTKLPNGKNYGFDINSERIVANKKWAEANPAAAKLFEIIKLPINAVSAENMMISNGEDSLKDIERHADLWINANQATFNQWIETAKQAAK
ncbi:glycine betaine/L-proline ABC transporter substrate-binding protein ProX [Oceanospirillum sediminis]|uniref:Glycine betaine/L-proline ABC transporter substrate-binding protein ProX n=1 Tax=Oceanospirillum sediminis TaxID=2760088 RepID=A0A839IJN6_9GAMM|nr:glycine betaine/L-proline ABC transporter substrate-binding protein ProX [Oceanospirillum sediminis]MBB1485553.1 glycine betaine/L-proline ABC transporter substrate-binding protein ProX [Oceanospirillum sediminis]